MIGKCFNCKEDKDLEPCLVGYIPVTVCKLCANGHRRNPTFHRMGVCKNLHTFEQNNDDYLDCLELLYAMEVGKLTDKKFVKGYKDFCLERACERCQIKSKLQDKFLANPRKKY